MNAARGMALLLLLAAGLWFAFGGLVLSRAPSAGSEPARGEMEAADAPFVVEVAVVSPEPYRPRLSLSAHAEPVQTLTVRARAAGQVVAAPRREGERLAAGDTLCRLDDTGEREQLAAAEARLASAERDAVAARRLFDRGTLPEAQLKKAEAALAQARAAVKRARLAVAWRVVKSPIAGMLQKQLAKAGDMLQPGAPCAVVVALDPLEVVAAASELEVSRLRPGMAVRAHFANGRALAGTITYIAPAGSAVTRTFTIKARLANPDMAMRAGMTARLDIPLPGRKVARLPLSALVLADDGRLGAHVVRGDDTVAFVPLTIVSERPQAVLAEGLPAGARVIVTGQYFVRPGQKVRPVPRKLAAHADETPGRGVAP